MNSKFQLEISEIRIESNLLVFKSFSNSYQSHIFYRITILVNFAKFQSKTHFFGAFFSKIAGCRPGFCRTSSVNFCWSIVRLLEKVHQFQRKEKLSSKGYFKYLLANVFLKNFKIMSKFKLSFRDSWHTLQRFGDKSLKPHACTLFLKIIHLHLACRFLFTLVWIYC